MELNEGAQEDKTGQVEEVPAVTLPQQKSKVVKPGEKRSKKGKRRINSGLPPPLAPDDYVKVVPVSKQSEVLHDGKWRPVSLSNLEKAPQIELDEALTRATSRKGYRMVRATHGACEGTWFYEVAITHLGSTGHVRLGWSTRKGELQAPVGYDENSFAYRDLEGTKVHKALREEYGEPFQEGDVIGCYLHLGEGGRPFEKEKSDIVTWKGGMYFKEDAIPEQSQPLKESKVAFTKNGIWQGIAYEGMLEGTYYPAESLYTLPTQSEGASITVNFGPDFKYPCPVPADCPEPLPVSNLAGERPLSREPADAAPQSIGPESQQTEIATQIGASPQPAIAHIVGDGKLLSDLSLTVSREEQPSESMCPEVILQQDKEL